MLKFCSVCAASRRETATRWFPSPTEFRPTRGGAKRPSLLAIRRSAGRTCRFLRRSLPVALHLDGHASLEHVIERGEGRGFSRFAILGCRGEVTLTIE